MSWEGVNGVIRNTPRHFAGSRGWETCWQGSIRGNASVKSGRSTEPADDRRPRRQAETREISCSATPLLPIAPRVGGQLLARRLGTANRSVITRHLGLTLWV